MTPLFKDTAGLLYTIPGAVPYNPPPAIIIPSNAKSSGILDNFATWKQEKDGGTGGTVSSMFNKYIDANTGRQFNAIYANKAGVRWSTNFVKDPTPTNFVYDLFFKCSDLLQLGQLELDMNHMIPDGRNVYLCVQANTNDGSWDYTTTPAGRCHWNKSNIPVNLHSWVPNVWRRIRIWTSHDFNGIVTYHGIELDGVYAEFDASCKGLSAIPENWTPNSIINNYQTNGALANGVMNTFAKQMQVIYW